MSAITKFLFFPIYNEIKITEIEKCHNLVKGSCPIKANEVVTHKFFKHIECKDKKQEFDLRNLVKNEENKVLVCFSLKIKIMDNDETCDETVLT